MAERPPRARALFNLWTAHRELTALEWLEFRQTLGAAVAWSICAAISGIAGWLALNAAVVLAFYEQPLWALAAIVVVNLLAAAVAGARSRRLLRRPFFALTRREAARDVGSLFEVIS